MKKPIKAGMHGTIDYIFSGLQMILPAAIGVNKKAVKTFAAVASGFTAMNALTDTPAGIKKVIPFKTQGKIDMANLGGLALLTFAPAVRNDKRALAFHLIFLAAATANYLFTDYDS